MIKAPQSGQTAIAATLIASKLWSLIWKTLLMCCGKSYSLQMKTTLVTGLMPWHVDRRS